ncbi:MarR family transcriptional regulator [Halorubrum sp. Ib24]|uniref:helix-turn-helix transcriptional regulator n=1 Tax=Halorubrum sp. Ib24 TaxID=1383850 RepID=UPI000B99BBFA|nr:MarR family transcriptional regulator [Halorubrum sp. Ib24]OYR41332.1 MarR family transcriptional regulator [Halorubrum sp. Ib24]
MGHDSIPHQNAESPISDIAYLARSEHRVPTLVALTERPRSRSELCELAGVSSSTIRRTLDEFEDRVWIRKDGYQYTATRLGEAIASAMQDLIEQVETERKLRDVWHWLPEEVSDFPIETWDAMTITVAEPDSPYRPIDRFESLLKETNDLRLVRPEIALMEPCFEVLVQLIDEGVDVVLVARPESHTYFLSTYPERSVEMMQQDNFTVLEHDSLPPCGTGLLDERAAISCYEQDSGTVHVLIDTDVAAIREWAQSVCDTYASEAQPVEPP